MRIMVATGFSLLLALAPTFAEDAVSPERIKTAGELIEVSGAAQAFSASDDMIAGMFAQFRKSGIDIDAETETKMKAICREELEAAKPTLLDKTKEIYARHFSETEMRDMIAFYRSPTGQKVVAEMPALMRESVPLSSELMMRVMNRAVTYMQERAQEKQKQ